MDALNVLTLEQAKANLRIDADYTEDDTRITGLIKTAVALVEQYTGYYLYERDLVLQNYYKHCLDVNVWPINSVSGVDSSGDVVTVKVEYKCLDTLLFAPANTTITINAGYTEAVLGDMPEPFRDACYKIITYLYENRDAYTSTLPYDIQLLLNTYRRSPTI